MCLGLAMNTQTSKIMQVKALQLKLISPIPPPRDAYYNPHKEYELGSMEILKEVPFGRVVMGLLVFLKVGIDVSRFGGVLVVIFLCKYVFFILFFVVSFPF